MQNAAIAAISTAQAPGGIGVIRLSGEGAPQIADRVFVSRMGTLEQAPGYTALYGKIVDENGEKLDEAVALRFCAPHSFTGEDVVEFSCHGGLVILQRVLAAVLAAGARPAGPGEFTRRAFCNGKMDLTEAEAVMQMISARGTQAARAALSGHDGALSRRIGGIRQRLLEVASHLAAWADYPDDDIPQVTDDFLRENLCAVQQELQQLLLTFDAGRVLREGVDTVIVGRPNAGKSTLMNRLTGTQRSIVTEIAGTTRDVVEETVQLGQVLLRLSDTAGIRDTDDPVEKIGVQRAREKFSQAELILMVFDASQELNDEDRQLMAMSEGKPHVAVVNKTDLCEKIDKKYIKSKNQHIVYISAQSGEGMQQLEQEILRVLHAAELNPGEGILYTERQRQDASHCLSAVEEAQGALQSGMTLDAVTVSVEAAVDALLELTGERATTAVVDEVFAHFCVGK